MLLGMVEIVLLLLALIVLLLLVRGLSLSVKLVWNGLLGAIGLYLYNFLALSVGFKTIAISIINVLIVGFFGIPGLIALIVWQFLSQGSI